LPNAFHKPRNQVIISDRRKALLDEVAQANPGMHGIELDIQDPVHIKAVAQRLIAEFPTLNVVFNNAGIMPFDDASGDIDDESVIATVNTNFLGPIRIVMVRHGYAIDAVRPSVHLWPYISPLRNMLLKAQLVSRDS
jgi:uncharacterized oxidoreductase